MQPASSRDGTFTRSNSSRNASAIPGFGSKRTAATNGTLHPHLLPHVELELPAPPIASHTPKLQYARLGHDTFETHRHHFAALARLEAHFHRGKLFQLV